MPFLIPNKQHEIIMIIAQKHITDVFIIIVDLHWRRQESEVGGQSSAGLVDGSPQWGPVAEPQWESGGFPQKLKSTT